MMQVSPRHTIRTSSLAVRDAVILNRARTVIAQSLQILRECQPGTFLGDRRHGGHSAAGSRASDDPTSTAEAKLPGSTDATPGIRRQGGIAMATGPVRAAACLPADGSPAVGVQEAIEKRGELMAQRQSPPGTGQQRVILTRHFVAGRRGEPVGFVGHLPALCDLVG
jgi:hypothetical protein